MTGIKKKKLLLRLLDLFFIFFSPDTNLLRILIFLQIMYSFILNSIKEINWCKFRETNIQDRLYAHRLRIYRKRGTD